MPVSFVALARKPPEAANQQMPILQTVDVAQSHAKLSAAHNSAKRTDAFVDSMYETDFGSMSTTRRGNRRSRRPGCVLAMGTLIDMHTLPDTGSSTCVPAKEPRARLQLAPSRSKASLLGSASAAVGRARVFTASSPRQSKVGEARGT